MNRGARFKIETLQPDIGEIVRLFDRYLDGYPVKTSKSMHSLLGPIPMILDGARVRKESVQTLIGRAVRFHEMNPKSKGFVSAETLASLEIATKKLLDLCLDRERLPLTAISKVTERIRYSVYYERRKKGIEWLERTRVAFVGFLKEKYSNDGALITAWGEKTAVIESVNFPSDKNDGYKRANTAKKADIDEFRTIYADAQVSEEDDENE